MKVYTIIIVNCFFAFCLTSCKYSVVPRPKSSFTDQQLYDSCNNTSSFNYYKNAPTVAYSGIHGPHGSFKLKFNKIAWLALTDGGKLPLGNVFPEGSLVVKEAQSIGLYAFMYKSKNSWLWGKVNTDGSTVFSVDSDPTSTCINCHSQSGQRDLVLSFNFY